MEPAEAKLKPESKQTEAKTRRGLNMIFVSVEYFIT